MPLIRSTSNTAPGCATSTSATRSSVAQVENALVAKMARATFTASTNRCMPLAGYQRDPLSALADGKVIEGRGAIFGDGTAQYDAFWS